MNVIEQIVALDPTILGSDRYEGFESTVVNPKVLARLILDASEKVERVQIETLDGNRIVDCTFASAITLLMSPWA